MPACLFVPITSELPLIFDEDGREKHAINVPLATNQQLPSKQKYDFQLLAESQKEMSGSS